MKRTRTAIANIVSFIAAHDGWIKCQSCGTKAFNDPAVVRTIITMRMRLQDKTTCDFTCTNCGGEGPARWRQSGEDI